MSTNKKSQLVALRMPAELLAEVRTVLEQFDRTRTAAPLNLSTFIIRAIRRDLAHVHRSRKKAQLYNTPSNVSILTSTNGHQNTRGKR